MPAFDESPFAVSGPILGIDTGSPTISVAVVASGTMLAERSAPQLEASERLLRLIEEVLEAAGLRLPELAGIAALRGPGSFTGLRIGLATVLGLHQSTGLPAAAVATLAALAAEGAEAAGLAAGRTIVSAVDALRDEWTMQRFAVADLPSPQSPPALVSRQALEAIVEPLVGHGLGKLAGASCRLEPRCLGAWAAKLAARDAAAWDVARLVEPLYARPAAVTLAPSGLS